MSASASCRNSVAALLLAGVLAGCGADRTVVVNRLVTAEQEIADLQRARDLGIITPDEFAEQRAKVLRGR